MQNSSNEMVPESSKRSQQFEALTFPLMDRLYSTAVRMTRDQLDAEDLVQDTYLKAYRFFHRFQPGTNFRVWMFRILTNNFISDYNDKKRQPMQSNFETTCAIFANRYTNEINNNNAPDLNADYHELFDDTISAALGKLPEDYRVVILLCDVNNLTYKEIAKILNRPIGTVMSRLNRGRRMLAKFLKRYAQANGYANVCVTS